jgi:hypothetical protein
MVKMIQTRADPAQIKGPEWGMKSGSHRKP